MIHNPKVRIAKMIKEIKSYLQPREAVKVETTNKFWDMLRRQINCFSKIMPRDKYIAHIVFCDVYTVNVSYGNSPEKAVRKLLHKVRNKP